MRWADELGVTQRTEYLDAQRELVLDRERRFRRLMGQVRRPTLKSSAERVVQDIEGVENVVNNIEVLPTSPNDDRIRMAAYRAIYGHTALNRYAMRAVPPIHIIVKNGDITLEGVVANESDKNIAYMQAQSVSGAFKVTNNLRVEKGGEE